MKSLNCPKCGGNLILDRDEDKAWYLYCLQCGYSKFLEKLEPLKLVINARPPGIPRRRTKTAVIRPV